MSISRCSHKLTVIKFFSSLISEKWYFIFSTCIYFIARETISLFIMLLFTYISSMTLPCYFFFWVACLFPQYRGFSYSVNITFSLLHVLKYFLLVPFFFLFKIFFSFPLEFFQHIEILNIMKLNPIIAFITTEF